MVISKCFSVCGSEVLFVLYLEEGNFKTPHVFFLHPKGRTIVFSGHDIDHIYRELFNTTLSYYEEYPCLVTKILSVGSYELKISLIAEDYCEMAYKDP